MRKFVLTLLFLVVALVGGLYGLTFLDINTYRAEIEALAEEQTGRKLELGGSLSVGFSLMPKIVARDVRFANTSWGSKPYMLEAKEVGITLSLVDLFRGDIGVSHISVVNSILLLEVHRSGAANWEFPREAPRDGVSTAGSQEIVFPDIHLIDTSISYRSQRLAQVFQLNLAELSLAGGLLGTTLAAEGDLDGLPVSLQGVFAGPVNDFSVSDFVLSFGGMKVEGNASAKRAGAGGPYHAVVEVAANRTDITSWLDLQWHRYDDQRSNAEGPTEQRFLDQPLDLSFLDIATMDISLSVGRLGLGGGDLRSFVLTASTTSSSAAVGLKTIYNSKPIEAGFKLERRDVPRANLSLMFSELDLEQLATDANYSIDVGAGAIASGKADLSARGLTPRELFASLTGTLEGLIDFDELDLSSLAGRTADAVSAQSKPGVFSTDELPLEFVDGFNGKLDVKVDRLLYGDLVVTNIDIPIRFNGQQVAAEARASYHGQEMGFSHKAQLGTAPTFDFDLIADDFELGKLLSELGVTDLANIRADLALRGSASGRSPKSLASTFTGSVNLVAGEGEIASSVFELIAADLVWALVPKGSDGGKAKLTCVLSRIDFVDGVGTLSAFALVTKRMRTKGSGTVDLASEKLNLTFYPRPNNTSLLSLSTPIRVTGSISDPRVLPDTTSILLDAAKALGAGVLTGGIGAVLPLMSLQNFDAEDAGACVNTLSDRNQSIDGIGETIGAGAGAIKDNTGSFIEGVGDFLTSSFK